MKKVDLNTHEAGASQSEKSLESLLTEAALGNESAFTQFIKRTEPVLALYMNQATPKMSSADLVQETYLSLWRSLESYDPRRSALTWLFTIARSRVIDCHRKSVRRPTTVPLEHLDQQPLLTSDPSETFDNSAMSAIAKLNPSLKEAFVLVAIIGFSYDEAAEIAQVPAGTVKSRVHSARVQLSRALLADQEAAVRKIV